METRSILYPPAQSSDTWTFQLDDDVPAFAGHFPGNPIAPGALMLHWMLEFAKAQGVPTPAAKVTRVRFLHEVKPGDALKVQAKATRRGLQYEVFANDTLAASAVFPSPAR